MSCAWVSLDTNAWGVRERPTLADSKSRIAQLEDEIKNVRTVMDQRVQEQQSVTAACNAKKLDVQRVLEFFGQEAVARVVREAPKLYDPSAPAAPANQQ